MESEDVIAALGLAPHPEGGWFRETHRDSGGTAIYFLLEAGARSHWHRVIGSSETWHHYRGAPLLLYVAPEPATEGHAAEIALGPDLAAGQRPQFTVRAGWWQAAEARQGWALVGCTVSPPFDFARFELAPEGFSPA